LLISDARLLASPAERTGILRVACLPCLLDGD